MRISILTPDFSSNCFGRAWLLAKLLQRNYDVEVIGPAYGEGIWKPLKDACDFEAKIVKGYDNGRFDFKEMLSLIKGEVIYASKPLMPSFGMGLVKKIRTRKPLVLDIDDWELGFRKEFYDSLILLKKINDFRLSISNWRSYYYALILDKLIRFSNEITVSGRILQARYGGTIIWHGRDVNTFNPERFNGNELKRKFVCERNDDLIIVGFIGTPRLHKGLEDLIDAMSFLQRENLLLVIVGADEGSYCTSLKKKIEDSGLKKKVIFFTEQPFGKLPEFIGMIDLVIIPQTETPASYGQVPAKIFDAMAMAKPVIATSIGDIPEVLDACGWIVEPGVPQQIVKAIQHIIDNPARANEMGLKAREKCKREYSWDILEQSLVRIFSKYEKK